MSGKRMLLSAVAASAALGLILRAGPSPGQEAPCPQAAGPARADSIVGKWLVRTPDLELTFEARADGTFSRTMKTAQGEERSKGTYTFRGGVLEVRTEAGEVTRLNCKVQGDEMAITDAEGNGLRLKRQAQAAPPGAPGRAQLPQTGAPRPGGPGAPLPPPGPAGLKTLFPLPEAPGGHIIYTRAVMTRILVPGLDSTVPIPKLFVMDANGVGAKPFVFGDPITSVKEAHWSGDYRRLAFSSDWKCERSACVHDIFACPTDGTPATRLTGGELRIPAPGGYGSVMGLLQDNTKSKQYKIETAAGLINITAQGMDGVVVHPGELTDVNIVDPHTKEKLREERMHRFFIPRVAAGKTWVKIWVTRNIGEVLFVDVRAGETTDLEHVWLNEGNFAAGRPSLTPDGRYCVGMGYILSEDPTVTVNVNPDTRQRAELGAVGASESVTVTDVASGMPVATVDKLAVRALSVKDPVLSPDGRLVACALGQPTLESLALLRLQDILANRPQPRIIVPGQRILPNAVTIFKPSYLSCVDPAWSPDGTRLAFCRFAFGEVVGGDIFLVNADGTGLRQLTRVQPNQLASRPCFSPDGKRIAFTLCTGKNGPFKFEQLITLQFTADIYSMSAEGGDVQRLTTDGMSSEPAWGP